MLTPLPTIPIHLIFLLSILSAGIANATNYYVDAAAPNDSGNGSISAPKKTLSAGVNLMSPNGGDILTVRAGTYSSALDELVTLVNGKAGSYNTIKAATDGSVVITANLNLTSNAAYIRFEGLKWKSPLTKSILGHHLKFLRCAFIEGPPSGNEMTLSIGTNDVTPGAQYILLEDVWVFGPGGRYNIIVYNSDKIILRRVVVRHDGGWSDTKGDPEAGIAIYNSSDTQIQNGMVVDSNLPYYYWEKAFYNVKNSSSLNPHRNTKISGSIALNNVSDGFGYDDAGPIENAVIENSVAWNTGGGVALGGGSAGGHSVIARNLTVGATSGHAYSNYGANSTLDVSNAVAYGNSGNAFGGSDPITHSFNDCNSNSGGNCSATGEISLNPLNNGLKYLPRIEAASALKTAGLGGGQIGAELVKRIGASETLFGEAGYDAVTSENLWPWPYQQRIKTEMCNDAGISRGFCSASSLTHYVWEYLGNACPIDICSAPSTGPPIVTLSAIPLSVPAGSSTTLIWSSTNATTCAASGAWSGVKAISGTETQPVTTTPALYALACTGVGGRVTQSVTVMVISAMATSPPSNQPH